MGRISRAVAKGSLGLIHAYRYWISPILGTCCRFEPSCSEYAILAIRRFGIVRAAYFVIQRISKCHPWHPGGIDPVPPNEEQL